MVDVNNCSRKRSISEGTFEVNNDEVSILETSNVEDSEPEAKMVKKEDVVNNVESNSCGGTTINSVQTTKIDNCLQERVAVLQEENLKLKKELHEVGSKVCKCNININIDSLSNDDAPIITVRFRNQTIAECYRGRFLNFLKTIKEFAHVSDDLEISVRRNGIEKKEGDSNSPDGNRKRKRKKSKTTDLFTVDKTPSLVTKGHSELKYVSKYTVQTSEEASEKQEVKAAANICFNCKKRHNLRDCPEPKDYTKINAARQKMKSQQASKTRYHLEEDRKYSHFCPGKISEQLKEALGIRDNELPTYIYRMRRFGYPPGWMLDAKIEHSNLSLYDMEGKEDPNGKNSSFSHIDTEKIVEYAGFNMPLEPGSKDDYRSHDCPPFSDRCSKGAMITYLRDSFEKSKDNIEACDMDLDQSADDGTVPPGCEPEEVQRLSPSLIDLEKKKLELLAELDIGGNSTDSEEKKEVALQKVASKTDDNNKDGEEKTIKSVEVAETVEEAITNGVIGTPATPTDNVKLSVFGTPIIQSTSPYCALPHPNKFSKDISPVINFENLPNATGKYEQMTVVLQRVRKTLKSVIDKS